MAENFTYYVLNYDQQESFRVFVYVDRVKGERFQTMAEKRIAQSEYLSSIGICIRNDEPSVNRLFEIYDLELKCMEAETPGHSPTRIKNNSSFHASPEIRAPVELSLYRMKMLTMVGHTVLQNRLRHFFSLTHLR